jgi:RNA polymerase primary sigma factor
MKGFARSVPLLLAGGGGSKVRATGGDRVLADVADSRLDATHDRLLAREEVRQLLSRLDESERNVVLAHYGIEMGGTGGGRQELRSEPATYEQVGRLLGLTKQRVRQIEQSALAKLRSSAQAS